MAPARSSPSRQPPPMPQQRALQQRTQQVRRALADQQRVQQRALQQRVAAPPRGAQQRSMQQRRVVQQRRGVAQQRYQQRSVELQRQLELLRQQQQRLRIWQRTAAKRAARQVETEQAILEREERIRAYRRERESYESYVRRRHAEARAASAAAAERTAALDSLLSTALSAPLDVGFASLKRPLPNERFHAGGLDVPLDEPRPEQFQPAASQLPKWLPGQREARERSRLAAQAVYQQAVADYRAAEFDRVRRLSVAKLRHQRRQAAAAEETRAYNAAVDRLRDSYLTCGQGAVERYARIVLSSRSWPDGVRLAWRLRYHPGLRQLDAECVLPGPDVVPLVRRYRYVAAVDAQRRQFIPPAEVRERYARFVAQAALCALADLFDSLAPEVVDVIQLNARVAAGDQAPPGAHRPHLVSIAAARSEWVALRSAIGVAAPRGLSPPPAPQPFDLLRRLDARVSPDPYDRVPVQPWADFDE
jgi:restriction system protein